MNNMWQSFRKKPVVIKAMQWYGDTPDFPSVGRDDLGRQYAEIKTLEGTMRVNEGDWIITGVQGEQYPCKPDIFDATYERVIRELSPGG